MIQCDVRIAILFLNLNLSFSLLLQVYDSTTGALHSNISSPDPLFLVTALRPGLSFLMVTYAANAKGRSDVAKLETFMMKVAEKRTGKTT